MTTIIDQLLPEIIKIRREIHANPELGFNQQRTAKIIIHALRKFGYTLENQSNTGIVAILDSGKPGKTVGLRADFDGLPITEQSALPYVSTQKGKMHACGHDGHTANLLCVAAVLAKMTDQFKGKVKFIFQPAEELGEGAKTMINEKVLDNPYVDAIFGLHNWPGLPIGHVAVKADTLLTGITTFDIIITGKGGHASMPQICIDPVLLAAQLTNNLQSIVSRSISTDEFAVLSITKVHGGDAYNVIPNQVVLGGSMRFISTETQKKMQALLQQHIQAVVSSVNAQGEIKLISTVPPTVNSEAEAKLVYQTALNCLGESQVSWIPKPFSVTEDFAFFLQQRPGSFFCIGNGEDSQKLHTAKYDFNDQVLPHAVKLLSQIAIDYLNAG